MKMHILIIKIFLLMAPFSVSSFAQKDSSIKTISVVGIKGINTSDDLAQSIQEHIESRLSNCREYTVVSRQDMNKITEDRLKKHIEFIQSGFRPTLEGNAIAIQKVITGTISSIGPSINIVLKLIDVKTGVLEHSVSRQYLGSTEGIFLFTDTLVAELIESKKKIPVIDTTIIPVQASVIDSQQIIIKKEVATEQKPEPAPVHDEKTDGMSEKIGMGALAIFATLAVIILYNKTN